MPDFACIEKFFATMFQIYNFQKTSFVFESKFRSRCSTDKLVRAPFLNHCALKRSKRTRLAERRFPTHGTTSRARLPTLTIVASLLGRAASWVAERPPTRPFRYSRARPGRVSVSERFQASTHRGLLDVKARVGKKVRMCSPAAIAAGWGTRRFASRDGEPSFDSGSPF